MNLIADLILHNGYVITLEEDMESAEAVAVKDGRIIFVGTSKAALPLKGKDTKVVDLKGKALMPGFIESHAHPLACGESFLEVDCSPGTTNSIEEILCAVKEKASTLPKGQWILGRGWDDSKLSEKRVPTRWDLDQISPDHPVFLKRTCGHVAVANSKALEIGGVTMDSIDLPGGHIQKDVVSGEPTGILEERAQELIPIPEYSDESLREGMLLAQEQFAKWGITTIHDLSAQKRELGVYQNLFKNDELSVRYRLWLWALPDLHEPGVLNEVIGLGIYSGFGDEFINVQGVKFMLDGSIGGKTAAVKESYLHSDGNMGILYKKESDLAPHVISAIKSNLRVSMHAIGERAIDQALNILEKAAEEAESAVSMRNRIEHCTLANEEHVKRFKKLGVVVGSSTGFLYPSADNYVRVLGKERAERVFPHQWYKKYKVIAPGNSDVPVVSGNPFLGIYGLVTRKTEGGLVLGEDQGITVIDALKAYTIDGAYSSFEEDILGSIKENKLADMIVLSENPLFIDPEELKDIEVEMTVFNGKVTFIKEDTAIHS